MHKCFSLYIGRFQPFHVGHAHIIQKALDAGKSVLIALRDTPLSEGDPLTAAERVMMLEETYKGKDVKVIIIPDIESVNIGRKVGYEINHYDVPDHIGGISATEIRKMMNQGDSSWREKVPPAVADFMERRARGELEYYRKKEGLVVWFTGLSGTGKTTLAYEVSHWLETQNKSYKILDGDEIRTNLTSDLGFSPKDRDENIRRIGWVAKVLSDCGIITIVAAISPYHEAREKVKNLVGSERFIEIFVDCSIGKLIARDTKGLYKKALKGEIKEFTGISAPYETPTEPTIHIHTDKETIQESVEMIVDKLRTILS